MHVVVIKARFANLRREACCAELAHFGTIAQVVVAERHIMRRRRAAISEIVSASQSVKLALHRIIRCARDPRQRHGRLRFAIRQVSIGCRPDFAQRIGQGFAPVELVVGIGRDIAARLTLVGDTPNPIQREIHNYILIIVRAIDDGGRAVALFPTAAPDPEGWVFALIDETLHNANAPAQSIVTVSRDHANGISRRGDLPIFKVGRTAEIAERIGDFGRATWRGHIRTTSLNPDH